MQRSALAVSVSAAALACSTLAACHAKTVLDAPAASVKIARLQNVQALSVVPIEITRWLAVGASDVPPDLLPYGIVPTGTPVPHYEDNAQRFNGFLVNDIRAVDDALALRFMKWARTAGGADEHAICMYPEFGLDVWRGDERANVLISLSCGKIRVIAKDSRRDENLTMAQVREFVSLVKLAYGENIVHVREGDVTEVRREVNDGGAP